MARTKYFIKDRILHRHPTPSACSATYEVGAKLFTTPPKGYEKCRLCFSESEREEEQKEEERGS